MYLFISVGPLCLCSRASLGRAVGTILLALTLLILCILGGSTLARPCGGAVTLKILARCIYVCFNAQNTVGSRLL